MVLLIIIPMKNGYNWEYTLFSDKPIWSHGGFLEMGGTPKPSILIHLTRIFMKFPFETIKHSFWATTALGYFRKPPCGT